MYKNRGFVSPEKYFETMQASGYTLAQLHYAFVQWAAQKAQHPVKVALRDGAPIMHTANWLNEKKLANLKDWSPVWLNGFTSKLFFGKKPKEEVVEYFKQEGLDKPFTYVDTGYNGSIANWFDNNQPKKLQTLFMAGSEKFLKNNSENKRHAFLNELNFHEQLEIFLGHFPDEIKKIRMYEGFCENILEKSPKDTTSHSDSYRAIGYRGLYKNVNGTLQPELVPSSQLEIDAYNNYIKGMTEGLEDCSNVQQNADNKKQFEKYLSELFLAVPPMSHIFNSNENSLEYYGNFMPFFDETTCDELSRRRDKIEDLYRG